MPRTRKPTKRAEKSVRMKPFAGFALCNTDGSPVLCGTGRQALTVTTHGRQMLIGKERLARVLVTELPSTTGDEGRTVRRIRAYCQGLLSRKIAGDFAMGMDVVAESILSICGTPTAKGGRG